MARGILVPRAGIEPVLPAVEAQSPNHWTVREVLSFLNGLPITESCFQCTRCEHVTQSGQIRAFSVYFYN